MAKAHTAVGITLVRAPGGGLVLVQGVIDLSRAKSLSPAWTRDVMETRPTVVALPPNKENGRVVKVTVPGLTKVGETRVHGESAGRVAARANRELARLLDEALEGKEVSVDVMDAMVPPPAPSRVVEPESANHDKFMHGEREAGFVGLADVEVRKRLLAMGRRKSDIDRYLAERKAAAA